jgi:hypothetical protein
VCSKNKKEKKKLKLKNHEKKKKKKERPKVKLIHSHINHTFLILNAQIEPQAFKHSHCTIRKTVFCF